MSHYLVTLEIPMPPREPGGPFVPLRTSVSIEAPHADAARWQCEQYGPSNIIDVQEVNTDAQH
jgi:hypothetical protein